MLLVWTWCLEPSTSTVALTIAWPVWLSITLPLTDKWAWKREGGEIIYISLSHTGEPRGNALRHGENMDKNSHLRAQEQTWNPGAVRWQTYLLHPFYLSSTFINRYRHEAALHFPRNVPSTLFHIHDLRQPRLATFTLIDKGYIHIGPSPAAESPESSKQKGQDGWGRSTGQRESELYIRNKYTQFSHF